MNEYDLILAFFKKQILDLTYFENVQQWSKVDYTETIHDLNVSIQNTCKIMTIIGSSKFWISDKGIKGWDGNFVDVFKRFNLFKGCK